MGRAWWRVSTDAMVWSNLPARPPNVTMASTWKDKQNLIRQRQKCHGLIHWIGSLAGLLVFVSMKNNDSSIVAAEKQREKK